MNISFYDVDASYTDYLRDFDHKVPRIKYSNHDKFLCGVVLIVNDCSYYAPISSFNKKQFTNLPIYHKGNAIGSIRFSYMFPCLNTVLTEKNFEMEADIKYRELLKNEWKFCNDNYAAIVSKAKYIYKRYMSGKDLKLISHCCNFPLLEQKMKEYLA